MTAHAPTLLATHTGSDLDGIASLVALRYLYPDAALVLHETLEDVVRELLKREPLPLPVVRARDVVAETVKRLVLADVHDLARVGAWVNRIPASSEIIAYDHHPRQTGERAMRMVWGEVGATCTLITEELVKAAIRPEPADASLLLAGLYEDTGQLAFRSAQRRDFAAALQLVEWGADPALAADMVQRMWDFRQESIAEELRKSQRIEAWGNLRAAIARVELPVFVPDLGALASRVHAPGADAVFLLAGLPQKTFLIARSLREGVDVAPVAVALGGGGHPQAASAILRDQTVVEAETALLRVLADTAVEAKSALAIMSAPPIGVSELDSLAVSCDLMAHHRIGGVIVFRNGTVIGALDYTTAASAVAHGLRDEVCGPYAHAVPFVAPDTSLAELRARLLDSGERLYVVGSAAAPAGVVTRRDILREVYQEALPEVTPAAKQQSRGLAREIQDQLGTAAESHLRRLGELGNELGAGVYLVGGCVRDLVLRKRPVDWDLVATGDAARFLERLRREATSVKIHGRFQTAHIVFDDGTAFDLATARKETYARPGALPVVRPAGIEQDLFRRDFTINAMAIDLHPSRFGQLIDRFRGLDDLKHQRVRVLHSLSFVDDPTRAFRAVRLAVRFAFEIVEETARLMERAVALRILIDSEGTRLRRELLLAFREDEPLAVYRAFEKHGLLAACLPDYRLESHEDAMRSALEWTHWYRVQFGEEVVDEELLLLGSLALGASGARAREILEAFKLTPVDLERWFAIKQSAHDCARELASRAGLPAPSAAARRFEPLGHAALLTLGVLYPAMRQSIISYLTAWSQIRLAISGDDLKALGVAPGPEMGRILNAVRDELIDGVLPHDRQAQMSAAKRYFRT